MTTKKPQETPEDAPALEQTEADQELAPQPSWVRRHPVASAVAGGVIAVVLIAGLTAWGVGAAVSSTLASSTSGSAGSSGSMNGISGMSQPKKGIAATGGLGGKLIVRATINSMTSSSWSVTTRRGQTATVSIDSKTQFGSKKMPATAESFAVGDSVMIVADDVNATAGTGTALRIVAAKNNAGSNGSGSAATPSPTPTPMS